MDNRNNKRLQIQLAAYVVAAGKRHEGFVENLSHKGMCLTMSPTLSAKDFIPGSLPEIELKPTTGKPIHMQCDIRWLHSFILPSSATSVVNTLGVQILNPTQEYLTFFDTLQ